MNAYLYIKMNCCVSSFKVKIVSHRYKDRIVAHSGWPTHYWIHCALGQCFGLNFCCSSWNLWIWTDLNMIWVVLRYICGFIFKDTLLCRGLAAAADSTSIFPRSLSWLKKNDANFISQACLNCLIYYVCRYVFCLVQEWAIFQDSKYIYISWA